MDFRNRRNLPDGLHPGQLKSELGMAQEKRPLSSEGPCKRNHEACLSTESGRRKSLTVGAFEDFLIGRIMIGKTMF